MCGHIYGTSVPQKMSRHDVTKVSSVQNEDKGARKIAT